MKPHERGSPVNDDRVPPGRFPGLQDILRYTKDPSVIIIAACVAAVREEIEVRAAVELAEASELARAATDESTAQLERTIRDVSSQPDDPAFLFFQMAAGHAGALLGAGR